MIRHTAPLLVADLGRSLFDALWELDPDDGWWRPLLAQRRSALIVAALDETGAIAWAACEEKGLVGVYVRPERRREGLGSDLLARVTAAATARWKGIAVYAQPRDRGGEKFFAANGLEFVKTGKAA